MTQRIPTNVRRTRSREPIRRAFSPEMLTDICLADEDEFDAFGERVDLRPDRGRQRFYYHKDNGSRVLAVAHLDSVSDEKRCEITDTAGGLLVTSPSLDDRLGAYVILDLLPKLGITVDWLLTTGEEVGDSTAADFEADKDYNWSFGFDRGGTDVVLYQYETDHLVDLVRATGATVGNGSYSDISYLDHLGCAGVNWGVGYRDYHGPRAHAWLEDTFRMVDRFMLFHEANASTFLQYDPDEQRSWLDNGWDDDPDDLQAWFADKKNGLTA